ncbi:hypothetical protein M408DRAFT_8879 [Serendipita vermifera MAFF 305830]|uniref:Uncharacterized protein n=1 Tax=Serendipita vermifera MAFF 305830 TaxID=933852 RepID=A0A0C3B7V6_SERVB|nr:hypothetical protein M408DRAFT_8879 [Serendipita vermifera MAFF 305830]
MPDYFKTPLNLPPHTGTKKPHSKEQRQAMMAQYQTDLERNQFLLPNNKEQEDLFNLLPDDEIFFHLHNDVAKLNVNLEAFIITLQEDSKDVSFTDGVVYVMFTASEEGNLVQEAQILANMEKQRLKAIGSYFLEKGIKAGGTRMKIMIYIRIACAGTYRQLAVSFSYENLAKTCLEG